MSHRRLRQAWWLVSLMLTCGMLTPVANARQDVETPPGPPSEPPTTTVCPPDMNSFCPKVLSWNVAGAVRTRGDTFAGYDTDPFRFVDVLVDRITAEQPQLVSLQEMCGSQMNYLISKLATAGYPMQHNFRADSVHEELCKHKEGAEGPYAPAGVGKAVLAVGSAVPLPDDNEPVCLFWQADVPLRFCAVHTREDSPGRMEAVAAILNSYADAGATIVAGDFNAEPNDPEMHDFYFPDPNTGTEGYGGAFYEPERNADIMTHAEGHIDHVLADHNHFSPDGMDLWVQPTDGMCDGQKCSDHSMVWAELHFTPPAGTPQSGSGACRVPSDAELLGDQDPGDDGWVITEITSKVCVDDWLVARFIITPPGYGTRHPGVLVRHGDKGGGETWAAWEGAPGGPIATLDTCPLADDLEVPASVRSAMGC